MSKGCREVVLLTALVVSTVLAGCSGSGKKGSPAYFSAGTIPPLQVPAGLDRPLRSNSLLLPEQPSGPFPPPGMDVEQMAKPPRIVGGSED